MHIKQTFKTNCFSDVTSQTEKASKQNIISKLNFESDEDALPFYALPPRTLLQIYNCTKHDEKMGFCKNRLYYISSRLEVINYWCNYILITILYLFIFMFVLVSS